MSSGTSPDIQDVGRHLVAWPPAPGLLRYIARMAISGNPGDRRLATDTRLTTNTSLEALAASLEVPALTVLAHPEAGRAGEMVILPELVSGRPVPLSRVEPAFAQPGSSAAAPLGEVHLSRQPLRLEPGAIPGEVVLHRAGSRTAVEVEGEALVESRTLSPGELERGVVLELGQRVVLLLHRHPATPPDVPAFGLIGDSSAMLALRRQIQLAAGVEMPVLLRGESGVGKELVARALHEAGPRRSQPYVTVNMAAIPPSLAASELFGAAKGAYTGAGQSKDGYFQRAHSGTLFLDEIGETPADVQPLLLRALESGEIQPLGSAESRRVDVRVIAASDANLESMLGEGRFRAPLFHRLAGFEIQVPPLRQRRGDIGRLLYAFLDRELGVADPDRSWLPADLMARLARYPWPGNVRQLRFATQRLAAAHRAGTPASGLAEVLSSFLDAPQGDSAPDPGIGDRRPVPSGNPPQGRWRPAYRKKEEIGEDELLEVLQAHRFELKPAAEALGISRTSLYELIASCPRIRTAADLEAREIEEALARSGGDVDAAAQALAVSSQGLKRRLKALGMR